MALGIVCIVTDAQKTNLNLVFAARGMGPETFSRKLCAVDPAATPLTPPTHWLASNAAGSLEELNILNAMTNGDLPDTPEYVVWGEDGVISAADAFVAMDGSVFHVYSAAGDIEPVDHILGKIDPVTGIRHGGVLASEGLQYVPEEEP